MLLREGVSRIPGECVTALTSVDDITRCPVSAVDRVGAVLPEQHIEAAATADRVTTGAAEDEIVAAPTIDHITVAEPADHVSGLSADE